MSGIQSLFDLPFLAAEWSVEYQTYRETGKDAVVHDALRRWNARDKLNEKASETAFINHFFCDIWGYSLQAKHGDGKYQCHPQFPVAFSGQTGGKGEADLALGNFSKGTPSVPQVLCEFKDIRSSLDAPQKRKFNTRSPVQQAFDYLRESRTPLTGNEGVEPQWAIVTDMNEFRLYHHSKGQAQSQRFVIASKEPDQSSLVADGEESMYQRFLFWRLFSPASLIAERGSSELARLLKKQVVHEQDVENHFYLEYKAYREHLYKTLDAANPDFSGSKGKLVRLTQRFLDRCIFILFCEDMGKKLDFPTNLFRDELIAYSTGNLYGADDSFPWDRLKSIFRAMDKGGTVGKHAINRFNGGLFEPLPELETLHIPAHLFCAERQGENADTLLQSPCTLLYFASKYNFGVSSSKKPSGAKDSTRDRVIDLYALGRIFEQSITELEIMEAEADGRDSLNLLTKRKRDGVYYTPEWATAYIVEETVGTRLRDIKSPLGLSPEKRPDDADIQLYQTFLKDQRRTAPRAGAWLSALNNYQVKLNKIRIVDPACGSGAFLIQTLDFLKREHRWVCDERERITRQPELWDPDVVINSILTKNLYGVDINPESIEITKLALWLHTATGKKDTPLSSLDHNIREGNSLVSTDFYTINQPELFTEDEKERVNAFDWKKAFPEVFPEEPAASGFDCVVGNPPYVKLQHFRRVQDKVARYLTDAKRPDGQPLYASTQTGNFDLYLPFIEKGTAILSPTGRMGFIAQNSWLVTESGLSIRQKFLKTRQLDRWVDFKGYQVFEEATTYTALQFFTGSPNDSIKCAFAPDGDVTRINWDAPDAAIPYAELQQNDAWNLMPDAERNLIARLKTECKTLEQSCVGITVGIQTSADHIYHLTRLDNGHFRTAAGTEVAIEPGLMRPLVSGPEAKRYQHPKTDTYLLFPYKLDEPRHRLFSPAEIEARFPNGWNYLLVNEAELRRRENGKMNVDNQWFAYNYPKNLNKQEMPKLCVAQTVPSMRVCYDHDAKFFFNNVRVNGILPTSTDDGWYLLGILNSPVVDFVFKRTAKCIEVEKYEANKQFIAPLPIPEATPEERRQVAESAQKLQELHTARRELIEKFERRLNSTQTVDDTKTEAWLWADLHSIDHWKKNVPVGTPQKEVGKWAKAKFKVLLADHLTELDARLKPGATLAVTNTDDELRLAINGATALELFDKPATPLLAAQWRHALRGVRVTEAFNGKRLVKLLLNLRATPDTNLASALLSIDRELATLDQTIAVAETAINTLTYRLYHLTPAEISAIETNKRSNA